MFKRFSFKFKLIFLSFALSAVTVVVGTISYVGVNEVEKSYDEVVDGVMPKINLINNMYLSYRSVRINLRTLGIPGLSNAESDLAVKQTVEAIKQYEEYDKNYSKMPFKSGEKELYDDVHNSWLHFKGIGERALALHASGKSDDHEKLIKIFLEDCPQAAAKYMLSVDKIKGFHEANAKTFIAESKASGSRTNQSIMLIAGLSTILGLAVGIIFAISISKSITGVTEALAVSVVQVNSASSQIATSSQELSQSATEQAASLEQTASSLEEISAMIAKASESASSTAASSSESQQKAIQGKNSVDKMVVSMNEISESNQAIMKQIDESNQQMTEIVSVIQEIGNKTKVINEIVFQTKLLSFNASVEAARAGEHGKGFAVVAEEVGKLAEMSGSAAKEISDMLNNSIPKVEAIVLQTKTRVGVLIDQAKDKVDSGVDVAKQCSEILNGIVENVARVSELANEIAIANQEQTQGVLEINKAMAQLDSVTQQNASASEEAASAAEELSAQAGSLKNSVEELVETIQGTSSGQQSTRSNVEAHSHSVSRGPKLISVEKIERKKSTKDGGVPNRNDVGFREV